MTRPYARVVSDLRGLAHLAVLAATGASHISEGVHRSVWRTLGARGGRGPGQTRGLTGRVYRAVRWITHRSGRAVDAALVHLGADLDPAVPESDRRATLLAALNGVVGDRLAGDGSPLATPMALHYRGAPMSGPTSIPNATGRIALFVHGLCMDDRHWRGGAHQDALEGLGYTPLALRYNTGRHISENGRDLATVLDGLVGCWPRPVREIAIVAHSMGGLVTRSAVDAAQQDGMRWAGLLRHVVFLGTPHHGAPLERAGNGIDTVLAKTPYAAPFARLGAIRSAGITDLRYGFVTDDDWQGRDRFRRAADPRRPVPLPDGVACYAVAATLASARGLLADRLVGDGLVPVHSALGHHADPRRRLAFAEASQRVLYGTNHMELPTHPEVTRQIVAWLATSTRPSAGLDRT